MIFISRCFLYTNGPWSRLDCISFGFCFRDKDNNSAVVPPLEVQVDINASSASYRNSACAGDGSAKTTPAHGSPTSSRSVNFLGEDGMAPVNRGSKRYKRQSVSVGDSIHEHSETNLERLSGINFVDDPSIDGALAQEIHRGGIMRASSPPGSSTTSYNVSFAGTPRSSISSDNVGARKSSIGPGPVLTEVESDRPGRMSGGDVEHLGVHRCPSGSTSSDSTCTETASVVHGDETLRGVIIDSCLKAAAAGDYLQLNQDPLQMCETGSVGLTSIASSGSSSSACETTVLIQGASSDSSLS